MGEAEQAGLTPRRGDSLLARRNLAHELSLEDTAERLGHADSSSFYKALRKWFGSKPGHYQALILRGCAALDRGLTSCFERSVRLHRVAGPLSVQEPPP